MWRFLLAVQPSEDAHLQLRLHCSVTLIGGEQVVFSIHNTQRCKIETMTITSNADCC